MAITPSLFSGQAVASNPEVVIEMLPSRPVATTIISPAKPAGQLCGYYDSTNGIVELFVVNTAGIKYIRVG
jgi:hypothetical protein